MPPRLLVVFCLLIAPFRLPSQSTPPISKSAKAATLNTIVSDPSGARVSGAAVHIVADEGSLVRDLSTDTGGRASAALPTGNYSVTITAAGFEPFFRRLKLAANTTPIFEASLFIAAAQTVVDVKGDDNALSTAGDANKDAVVFSGSKLAALSDDDATFQQQILAIAGGDGSHPPQVFVDGFSGGQFPPKSAIREVKINQNPYSAEYDSLGFGRIEISTKPGTGRIHGEIDVFGDPSAFNSQNPFIHTAEPGYYRVHTTGDLSGPLDKKTSFFVSADYYDQQNNAIINASTVSPTSDAVVAINDAIPDPQATSSYTARLDRQWSKNNTFTGRYEYDRAVQTKSGLGQASGNFGGSGGISCTSGSTFYTLPSQALNCTASQHTVQLRNSQILGAHAEMDTKFEWVRTDLAQDPVSNAPAVSVNGTANDGGNPGQENHDHQDHFEFQESGTYEHGSHLLRFGARYRIYREANLSTAGFNGAFTFNTLTDYKASVTADGAPSATPSAAQFTLTTGKDAFKVMTTDLGVWAEDEIKLRKTLTGNFGVRLETQTAIPDHFDPSPHFGLAWAPLMKKKKSAPVVYRIGSGIFYDRFPISNLLTAVREGSPTLQTNYTIQNPTFFARTQEQLQQDLDLSSASTAQTTYTVAPNFRSEYEIDSGASAEVSLGKHGSITFNYLNARGVHQWVSRNANAPLADGTRPFGAAAGDEYQFSSGGETLGNFFFSHLQINATKSIQFWTFAMVQRFNGDTSGVGSFASNSYDIHQDYGRLPWNRHQAVFSGVDADLKHGLHASLFLAARGGRPFNITTGADNNGDSIFNDRPSFASAADIANNPQDVVNTAIGKFNLAPTAGEAPIPIDYGQSPAFASLQASLQKVIKFGPRVLDPDADPLPPAQPGKPEPKPDPRYALVFSVEAQNVTNSVSPDTRIGVLTSPYFDQSIASANGFIAATAANRTITLHTAFRF